MAILRGQTHPAAKLTDEQVLNIRKCNEDSST